MHLPLDTHVKKMMFFFFNYYYFLGNKCEKAIVDIEEKLLISLEMDANHNSTPSFFMDHLIGILLSPLLL